MNPTPQASDHGQFGPASGNALKQMATALHARLRQMIGLSGDTEFAEGAYIRRPRIMSDIV